MAKKSAVKPKDGKVNKTAMIRAYVQEHPEAKAKEVIDALAASGIEIKDANYYAATRKLKNGSSPQPSGNGQIAALTAQLEAAKLVLKMGGIKQAKDALAKVADQPIFKFAVRAGSAEKAEQLIDQLEA